MTGFTSLWGTQERRRVQGTLPGGDDPSSEERYKNGSKARNSMESLGDGK